MRLVKTVRMAWNKSKREGTAQLMQCGKYEEENEEDQQDHGQPHL